MTPFTHELRTFITLFKFICDKCNCIIYPGQEIGSKTIENETGRELNVLEAYKMPANMFHQEIYCPSCIKNII